MKRVTVSVVVYIDVAVAVLLVPISEWVKVCLDVEEDDPVWLVVG